MVGHPGLLPQSRLRVPVIATHAGVVQGVDAGVVGAAARWLGAGRLDPGQVIDPAVGVEVLARPGAVVAQGDVLCIVHASDEWLAGRAVDMLLTAVAIAD